MKSRKIGESDLAAFVKELNETLGERANCTVVANSKGVRINARPARGESTFDVAADIDRLIHTFAGRRFLEGVVFDVRLT